MLHYRRRDSNKPVPARCINRHPLLTYINWSYDRSRHLDDRRLREILTQFDERYAHIYIRLFNEVPKEVLSSYLRKEEIDESVIVNIYRSMNWFGIDLHPFE